MRSNRAQAADGEPTGNVTDIKRFAIHDGPGIRTTVFFHGCPLECWWCHNPETHFKQRGGSYRSRAVNATLPMDDNVVGPSVRLSRLVAEVARDRIFYDQSGGGLTVSGGEPLMQPGFLADLLRACRDAGISNAVDTSGYAHAEILAGLDGLVDLYLYDLKIMDDSSHRTYTKVGNSVIHDNLDMILASGTPVVPRIPLIPGITETEANIDALVRFIADRPSLTKVCILPYNSLAEDKVKRLGLRYRPGTMRTQTPERLREIAGRFESAGLTTQVGG